MTEYSVVIPVYNGAGTLVELCNRVSAVFKNITENFEIIFVDDDSVDNSWQILGQLRAKDVRIKLIRLMRNFGQHNAIMCGFQHARGKFVITMDDDLQNPPEEIPKLISKIKEGHDLVYGEYISKKHGWFRNAGSNFVQLIYRKVFNVKGNLTAFRIITAELACQIIKYNFNYVFIDGLLAWNTKNIGYVLVLHHKRTLGKSGYSLRKLLDLSFNMITNFSIVPLRLASFTGLLFACLGFIMAIVYFIKKICLGIPVAGFATIIIAITIFSGIQLIILGLMGEYLGRILLNINIKPQFLIREKHV